MPEILIGSLPLLEGMAYDFLRDIRKARFRADHEALTPGQIRYQRCKLSRKAREMNAMLRRIAAASAEASPASPEDSAGAARHESGCSLIPSEPSVGDPS